MKFVICIALVCLAAAALAQEADEPACAELTQHFKDAKAKCWTQTASALMGQTGQIKELVNSVLRKRRGADGEHGKWANNPEAQKKREEAAACFDEELQGDEIYQAANEECKEFDGTDDESKKSKFQCIHKYTVSKCPSFANMHHGKGRGTTASE